MTIRSKCNYCNANRGVAKYPNGTWCFSCGKLNPIKSLINYETVILQKELNDADLEELPKKALNWLQKFYITNDLIEKNKIKWYHNRICFPYYIDANLIFMWLRDIDNNKRKWLFEGLKNVTLYYKKRNLDFLSTKLCIVEDVISAIRVSEFMDVVALGGTNCSSSLLIPLFLQYNELVCFLDGDIAGKQAAKKFKHNFNVLRPVKIVRTLKDPKCYLPTELKELLND